MFVEKHTYDAAIEKENERLRILRRGRQDPAASDLSYCKLYSICNEQLKFVQKECEDTGGRLVPGLPKRRFGDCNKRLVAQYKRVDKMRKRLEKSYDTCLADRITSKNASSITTCPADWPVLPLFEEQYICDQRKRVIQNHCTKI
uniref:CX9C domain-containing protein n=1 Tax=Panagrellus redivivus TaxID=6233 RepID=A0A7E4V1W6_PANRE